MEIKVKTSGLSMPRATKKIQRFNCMKRINQFSGSLFGRPQLGLRILQARKLSFAFLLTILGLGWGTSASAQCPVAVPTNTTAFPTAVCNAPSELRATTAGNFVQWFTVSSGGVAIGTSASNAPFSVSPSVTTTYFAESAILGPVVNQPFNFTGSAQTFVVPAGVTSLNVEVRGAQGGNANNSVNGGFGGRVNGTLAVTPGETLQINVGGKGGSGASVPYGGFNGGGVGIQGGGGGGASDIRRGGFMLTDRLVVAGGGGGGSCDGAGCPSSVGGRGGDATGEAGSFGAQRGGAGGGTNAGGLGANAVGCQGGNGSFGIGGNVTCAGPWSGGGGGGWYGGGAGSAGGGGGGSNFAPNMIGQRGGQSGDGLVTISYTPIACVSATRTPVTVTVNCCDFSTCVGKPLNFTATNSGASYAWSFGDAGTSTLQNPTHSYSAAGSYPVIFQLTDVNGCITTTTQTICVYDAPVVTNTSLNPLCNGATNGSIDVNVTGGAPGTTFTYVWSNGATTQDLSNVGAGSYTVTVTDGTTTCFSTLSVTLTEPVVLAAAATVGTNVLCFGAATGTATASATGGTNPYTYAWSNGQTVANATGLAAGNFTVTVTDANGCSTTASVTIAQPAAALAATETHTNVGCFGASTGAIDLTVTGGTTGYTYLWSNGATTQDLSGLAAGTYTVTVTDANGCSTTASATVGQPASALAVAPSNSGNVCQAGSNSNLLSNATGGTPGYTYLWTPGNLTTQNVNNVGAGTYNVTVTDANGCTATGSTTVGTFPGTPASFIISH